MVFRQFWMLLLAVVSILASAQTQPVELVYTPEILTMRPKVKVAGYELRLRGPDDVYRQMSFPGNSVPYIEPFGEDGTRLPDGRYVFELRFAMPVPAEPGRQRPAPMTGHFLVTNGNLVVPESHSESLKNLQELGIFPQRFGQLGLGTATPDPNAQIHLLTESDPRLRLERRPVGGAESVTWDLHASAQGFALTNASGQTQREPLFIADHAPSHSLFIAEGGEVGFGTARPDARMHLTDTGDADVLHVANEANTQRRRNVLTLENHGEVAFQMRMNPTGDVWSFLVREEDFLISRNGSRAEELRIGEDGTLYTHGSINPKSDVAAKRDFETVEVEEVLRAVTDLPIQSWSYRQDEKKTRHMGPTAQDFRRAFQLGADDGSISLIDSSGVALAAIKALANRLEEKDRALAKVNAQNQALEARLASLEAKMEALLERSP